MKSNHNILEHSFFVKKQVNDLTSGDIVLHPIYRADGLMLIKEYKVLSNDLAIKIKHQVPRELPIIILSSEYDMATFNKNYLYNNKALIKELEDLSKEYNEHMSISLDIRALIDKRVGVANKKESMDIIDNNENYYIDSLFNSSLFSTFENRLESSHLKIKAKKTKNLLIQTILKNTALLNELNNLKNYKDILLLHSINTTSISLMLGLTLELTEEELIDLSIANLLIDISVTKIPKDQFELHLENRNSSKIFYNLHLSQLKRLSEELPLIRKQSIVYGILDHYEYYNGTGYPHGKKAFDISLFGRIILIAQAYDEMVGGYFYNNGSKPIEAIQSIWKNSGSKFDPNILRIFIDRTTFFKTGQPIMLKNSKQGIIIGFKDYINSPLYPIVKLQDESIVDLSKTK